MSQSSGVQQATHKAKVKTEQVMSLTFNIIQMLYNKQMTHCYYVPNIFTPFSVTSLNVLLHVLNSGFMYISIHKIENSIQQLMFYPFTFTVMLF